MAVNAPVFSKSDRLLDAEKSTLTKLGKIVIKHSEKTGTQITIDGFDGDNCTCRDIAVQACLWAIGELQREALASVETPGGGIASVN